MRSVILLQTHRIAKKERLSIHILLKSMAERLHRRGAQCRIPRRKGSSFQFCVLQHPVVRTGRNAHAAQIFVTQTIQVVLAEPRQWHLGFPFLRQT
jgi:hypothetical protein